MDDADAPDTNIRHPERWGQLELFDAVPCTGRETAAGSCDGEADK